jgi:hypothetical protein
MLLKCKPTYKFQSIEFEIDCEREDLPNVMDLYEEILEGLIRISPDQSGEYKEPATEKQLAILKKFRIPHPINVGKEEARKLINESMNKSTK